MPFETETKILEVSAVDIRDRLERLGAEKTLEARLIVNWYRLDGIKEGEDPWFLRIRTRSNSDIAEVTWKGKSEILGNSRQHQEINILTPEFKKMSDLFLAIGLEKYAHQEKDRISWEFKEWKFDLDQYPDMPAYLEIEGHGEDHINEAIKLLDLVGYKASSEGERKLIQDQYHLDWYNMKF